MDKESLFEDIKSLYLKNPSMQATALWKLDVFLASNDTYIKEKSDSFYALHNGSAWTVYPFDKEVKYEDIKAITSAVLHEKQLCKKLRNKKRNMRSFFKLTHRLEDLQDSPLPDGFELRKVKWNQNKTVAKFIKECYENMAPKEATVANWKLHYTYDKDLWLWVIDKKTNKPAALGIAEKDKNIGEGSLEWIQVHPKYRKRKLGSILTQNLLQRLNKDCQFVTVSGDNTLSTRAEQFYLKNGFSDKETWWIIDSSLI